MSVHSLALDREMRSTADARYRRPRARSRDAERDAERAATAGCVERMPSGIDATGSKSNHVETP